MPLPLPDGVYESLVTQALDRTILEATQGGRSVQVEALSSVEGTSLLVRHLAKELTRRLASLEQDEQLELCNRVLAAIGATGPEATIAAGEARQALLAVYRDATQPPRPQTPLSLSGLLTGAELPAEQPLAGSSAPVQAYTAGRGRSDPVTRMEAIGRAPRVECLTRHRPTSIGLLSILRGADMESPPCTPLGPGAWADRPPLA